MIRKTAEVSTTRPLCVHVVVSEDLAPSQDHVRKIIFLILYSFCLVTAQETVNEMFTHFNVFLGYNKNWVDIYFVTLLEKMSTHCNASICMRPKIS